MRALALTLCLLGCAHGPPRPYATTSTRGGAAPPAGEVDYAERIADAATWRALASQPGREIRARTEVVKVIVDLADDWRVYFLQSRRWEVHYYFADRFLARPNMPIEEHGAFNIREYRSADRRFVLATITHHLDQDVWSTELVAGDTLDVPRTVRAFQALRGRVYFGDRLRYHPVPPAHDSNAEAFVAAGVPVVRSDELYAGVIYQPVNVGAAYGYLRLLPGEFAPNRVRRNDIVVLPEAPIDLPVCAGVITAAMQTPLSHVAVLAVNRGTPDMALRDALRDPRLRALEGRLVRLHVGPQDWSVREATLPEAERAWEAMRPRDVTVPRLDPRDVGLPALSELDGRRVDTVGAKAAQLAELGRITPPVPIPRGFAIPFHAYLRHLARSGADALVLGLRVDPALRADADARQRRLAEIRERITAAPVDPALLRGLRARWTALFPGAALRLRSSTNAEDLPGFNGAGLYRSTRVAADASDAALADALRAVWASTWNLQAHEEREFFRIDSSRVAMAVLAQESIDDDVVNGVAVTANPFNEGRPAVFLNAQVARDAGGAITSARADAVPEQVLWYTYAGDGEYERVSRSSLTQGAEVLREADLRALVPQLRRIDEHFVGSARFDDREGRAMDVEFILSGPSRRVVIVQARPITLRYDEGRGFALPP
ncbi:MAG: PEP/pyruvate-binding domain-containing protein [Polyangiales bacterium]